MKFFVLGSFLTFSAQGGRGKEKILLKPAEKIELSGKGGSAGGFKGGMPSRPSRSVAPPPCSERAEPSKILFSLIEKNFGGARELKNVKSVLLGGERQRAAAGRSVSRSVQKRFGFRQTNAQQTENTP